MRYERSIAVASYLVLSLVLVFWILDRQPFFGNEVADWTSIGSLIFLHVAVGFIVASWWALPLPFFAVAIAIPLGYPSSNLGEPLPIWQGLLGSAPIAVALIGAGVAARSLGPWQGGLGVR